IGAVAHRQHRVVDAVLAQMAQNPFDHGDLDDGQQLLGDRPGERAEAGALAADQDDCPHFLVVDVVAGTVVVVAGAAVVAGVIGRLAAVVVDGVAPPSAVVVVVFPGSLALGLLRPATDGGSGTVSVSLGTNAITILP